MKKTILAVLAAGAAIVIIAAMMQITGDADLVSRVFTGALIVFLVFLYFRRGRERAVGGARKFDGVEAQSESSSIRFDNVAANEEARESLKGLVDYLKNPEKYEKMGARMPRGVLMYGPPGTGKTLLARALAGEAGVPFFSLSGADFVQMYVGVGASRVRDLFKKARKAGRCVVFIDEIDAMGRKRDDMSSEERDQTLNALLSEMSGFKEDGGVIVLAATNRRDSLDPALLRPGRFDRQIEVGLPGRPERLSILKLHSKNKPLAGDIDLEKLACDTVRFSGASLESLMNEAAIMAARRGAEVIEQSDLSAAYINTVAGEDKKGEGLTGADRASVALHEAGHALVTRLASPDSRINRVSIIPSTRGAAGYSLSTPVESAVVDKKRLLSQIDILLAGRAAELIIGGEDGLSAGASNDLSRASEMAAAMVMDFGMAGERAVSLRALGSACSSPAGDAVAACRSLLGERFERVSELISENVGGLMRLTEALIERESLTGEDVDRLIFEGEGATA